MESKEEVDNINEDGRIRAKWKFGWYRILKGA
jgi:hypothetical protein